MTTWKRCALCNHIMSDQRCGSASVEQLSGTYNLCHTSDHSCYVRWVIYDERPPGWTATPREQPAGDRCAGCGHRGHKLPIVRKSAGAGKSRPERGINRYCVECCGVTDEQADALRFWVDGLLGRTLPS